MAITLSQNPTHASYGAATSVQVTFGAGGTNPSLYAAAVTQENTTASVSVADNRNAGNYTQDIIKTGGTTGNGGAGRSSIHSKTNASTLTATVTATLGSSTSGTLKCYELTEAGGAPVLDSTGGGNTITENTEAYSGTITTVAANCMVIACSTQYPGGDWAADTNYTQAFAEEAGGNAYHVGEYRVDAGTAGVITLTGNFGATPVNFSMAIAAYKAVSAAGQATRSDQQHRLRRV